MAAAVPHFKVRTRSCATVDEKAFIMERSVAAKSWVHISVEHTKSLLNKFQAELVLAERAP